MTGFFFTDSRYMDMAMPKALSLSLHTWKLHRVLELTNRLLFL